jgi:hypothetical protein
MRRATTSRVEPEDAAQHRSVTRQRAAIIDIGAVGLRDTALISLAGRRDIAGSLARGT